MIKVNEIAFTGYPVTDLKRARAFYEGALGLTAAMVHESDHIGWVEYEIGAGTLALGCLGDGKWLPSSSGPSCALEVDDFEQAIDALREAGVVFVVEPFESPVCRMAVIADPDGNSLTIHKRNAPSAS